MLSPRQAYEKARMEGPSDSTRNAVLSSAMDAYLYAFNVDECSRDDTRKAVLSNVVYSYWYALRVDRCPRDDTRKAVLYSPGHSYKYAFYIDKGPRDDTRNAVLSDFLYSCWYAIHIDEIIFRDSNGKYYFADIHNIGMRWIREEKYNIGFMSIGCFCLDVL